MTNLTILSLHTAACNNCSSDAYCACDVCDGTDYGCRCNSGFTGNGTYCAGMCLYDVFVIVFVSF